MNNKILTIIGPTAIGKTAIAIELAKKSNAEIIGLDSRQFYYGMEIGTAQPSIEERENIVHHLIGIRSPNKAIASGEYAKLVDAVIVDILQRNKTPIICGGAGLYYRALGEGIFEESVSKKEIRYRLEKEYNKNPQKLLNKLIDIDPDYSKIVHINNNKRMVRALEIFEITGKTPTEHFEMQKQSKKPNLDLFTILLTMDRKLLNQRIYKRTEQMLREGLIAEVKLLMSNYKNNEVHPLDSIGYRQVIEHISGNLTFDQMVEEINIKTRQYAKRQVTWFNNEPIDLEVDINNLNIKEIIEKIISRYNSDS